MKFIAVFVAVIVALIGVSSASVSAKEWKSVPNQDELLAAYANDGGKYLNSENTTILV